MIDFIVVWRRCFVNELKGKLWRQRHARSSKILFFAGKENDGLSAWSDAPGGGPKETFAAQSLRPTAHVAGADYTEDFATQTSLD